MIRRARTGARESAVPPRLIEGFRHSPFACDELCCHPELAPVPRVYFHVFNDLHDTVIEVDGEPYLALDLDQPCP